MDRVIKFPYSWHSFYNVHNRCYYAVATVYDDVLRKKYGTATLRLHDFIMIDEHNPGETVDHENHDGLDNRKCNLRVPDKSNGNALNRKTKNSNNKSGYRNVAVINGKFVVQLVIEGKNTKLGEFNDVDKAGEFAEKMRQKYYGEYAGNG